MPKLVTKQYLMDSMCTDPNCNDPNCEVLVMSPTCHRSAPVHAVWNHKAKLLFFFCSECDEQVAYVDIK